MMEALSTCCDLDSNRFSVAGYAHKAPLADNSEEAGRQRNRRIDIVILNGNRGQPGIVPKPTVPPMANKKRIIPCITVRDGL
jgi:hypothetical protein